MSEDQLIGIIYSQLLDEFTFNYSEKDLWMIAENISKKIASQKPQLSDDQHRLLDWLTEHFEEDDADALGVVCAMQTIGLRDEKIFDSALKLNDKQQAEVLQVFSAWVLEQEETK